MNKQVDVVVLLNGKQYTLSGYESEEYIQKVASYINSKYHEAKQKEFYKHLDEDMKNVLIHINIADDYFKLKSQLEDAASYNETKNNEIFELKHEMVILQSKLSETLEQLNQLKEEKLAEEKKNIRLETELNEKRKQH